MSATAITAPIEPLILHLPPRLRQILLSDPEFFELCQRLTREERRRFPPLCPDFVVELRSYSDSLETLQATMEEYRANSAQLGWLIDPIERKVYVYQPGADVVCLEAPNRSPAIRSCPVSCCTSARSGERRASTLYRCSSHSAR